MNKPLFGDNMKQNKKICFQLTFIFLCLLFPVFIFSRQPVVIPSLKDGVIFLTIPRSGTTWTGMCLQLTTGRNFWSILRYPFRPNTSSTWDIMGPQIPSNKTPIYHAHYPHLIKNISKRNKLVMTTRSYRELIIKWSKLNCKSELKNLDLSQKTINQLLEYYDFFESWPSENRQLINYEEMVGNPELALSKVLDFLDEPKDKLNVFLKNLEHYRELGISIYQNRQALRGGSISKGADLTFHSKTVSQVMLDEIDSAVESAATPYIWNKYLAKYKVNSNSDILK